MNTQDIETTLLKLRLSGMAQTLQTRVMQAQAVQEPFLDTLASLLQDELDRRRSRLMARRFKLSGLDEKPSLADFDWRFNPKVPRGAWVFRLGICAGAEKQASSGKKCPKHRTGLGTSLGHSYLEFALTWHQCLCRVVQRKCLI
jgi:IstB-like ATP binding protein